MTEPQSLRQKSAEIITSFARENGWHPSHVTELVRRILEAHDHDNHLQEAGWLPIETAPKDGTLVDLWVQPCSDAPEEYRQNHPPRRAADCYYNDYTWFGARWPMEPTHWMRAAPPPRANPKTSQGQDWMDDAIADHLNSPSLPVGS